MTTHIDAAQPRGPEALQKSVTYKRCPDAQCPAKGTPQSTEFFGQNLSSNDGYTFYCRVCHARRQKEWKAAHPEKTKAWQRAHVAKNREKNLARRAAAASE